MRGATFTTIISQLDYQFQSTRPVRGATNSHFIAVSLSSFQSTRPVRGATGWWSDDKPTFRISIHAPRAGRDPAYFRAVKCFPHFNPRAPCGARHFGLGQQPCKSEHFNPRAPCGARLLSRQGRGKWPRISIHAPRAGRDKVWRDFKWRDAISIHAPRAGRDLPQQARPPRERISIHAPRAGRDLGQALWDDDG